MPSPGSNSETMTHTTPQDGIVIQARTGSTRMPAKIIQPFDGDKCILGIIIDKCRKSRPDIPVIVATTVNGHDDVIEEIAAGHGALCYRGSEDDVLGRFIGAADRYGLDRVIRVCSDNPFLLTDSFAPMFAAQSISGADYTGYAFPDGRPTIKSHIGLFGELATTEALRRAAEMTDEKLYREHVTIYLYTHPEEFTVDLLPLPERLQCRTDLRLTLDTPEDFTLLKELYGRYQALRSPGTDALLELIDGNPEYGRIMKQNIALNEK